MNSTRAPLARLRAAVCLLAAAACSPGQPPPSPLPKPPPGSYQPQAPGHIGGTAVFSDWEFPVTLDVIGAAAETDLRAGSLLFAPLWGLDPDLRPYPDLVREVPTLENGDVRLGADGTSMTVTVKLVPGLAWSDGEPLTAEDVIFTWQAICDPATAAAETSGLDHIAAMGKLSDTDLLWTFAPGPRGRCGSPLEMPSGVYAPYLQLGPQFWVMPKHRLAAVAHAQWASAAFFKKPDATSGPFRVAEVVPEERITMVANPHYADGRSAPGAYAGKGTRAYFTHAPYLEKVVYKIYGSRDAMLEGLKAGETDLGFHLGPQDLDALRAMSGFSTEVYTGLRNEFLNPNHGQNTDTHRFPPWASAQGEDRQLLEALDQALDRRAIVNQALAGAGQPSAGLYPSALREYAEPGLIPATANLDQSRRLLDADGWKAGGDGVRAKSGRRLEFSLRGVCGSGLVQAELAELQKQWSAVGAVVHTDCRPRAIFFASYRDGGVNATGGFDMTLFSNSWLPDPGSWAPVGSSGQIPSDSAPGGLNWNRCRDPELDRQLAAGSGTLEPEGRRRAYLAVQREWLAYRCTIPLFDWPVVRQVANRLHNFAANPALGVDVWNAADWWLSTS
ncbi:MAG TPA: peptide ABC transporter substrate-binding protein [Candidatus Acidoferrales bacterium]|nr:peptide ABC transporter substrate-binding protein [Candidatus Acidoferrales bacterium]